MTKQYTFKTIVAPEAVRNEFTALRDSLNSSDKELIQAFWNLGVDRLEDIKREVEMLQASAAAERLEKKELKLAAKPKVVKRRPLEPLKLAPKPKVVKPAKAKKVATKKAKKEAKPKKVQAAATLVAMDDDDFQPLVVDGTK